MLGDGSLTKGGVEFSTADAELLNHLQTLLPAGLQIKHKDAYDYTILYGHHRAANGAFSKHPLRTSLQTLGLIGKRAEGKFIPKIYLYADLKARIALLQGLLDTDGCVAGSSGTGIEFSTVSSRLAADMKELVLSLGGRVSINTKQPQYTYKGVRKYGQTAYRLYINLSFG